MGAVHKSGVKLESLRGGVDEDAIAPIDGGIPRICDRRLPRSCPQNYWCDRVLADNLNLRVITDDDLGERGGHLAITELPQQL